MAYVTWLSLFRISSPQERGISSVMWCVIVEDDCGFTKGSYRAGTTHLHYFHLIIVFQLSGTLHFLDSLQIQHPMCFFMQYYKDALLSPL